MAAKLCFLGRQMQSRQPELSVSHLWVGGACRWIWKKRGGWNGQRTQEGARRAAPCDPLGFAHRPARDSRRIPWPLSVLDLLLTQRPFPIPPWCFTLSLIHTHTRYKFHWRRKDKDGNFSLVRGLNTQIRSSKPHFQDGSSQEPEPGGCIPFARSLLRRRRRARPCTVYKWSVSK